MGWETGGEGGRLGLLVGEHGVAFRGIASWEDQERQKDGENTVVLEYCGFF